MRSPSPAMRKADGPMSTPRRLPPRSSGTPMTWTVLATATLPGEPFGDCAAGGAAVGDAVGDADTAESAAGHEESRVPRQRALDRLHTIEVPDVVLRVGAIPPVDAREERWTGDAQQRRDCLQRPIDEFAVGALQRARIARAADEGPQQDLVVRGAVRPLRRQP